MNEYQISHYRNRASRLNEHGVTLIELVIYMVVAGMMLTVAVTAFLGQNKGYNRQMVISEIQQNIRGATEQMSSDIRFAGIGFHESGDPPFTAAAEDYFAVNYWSDLSDYWQGLAPDTKKTIHYRLDTTDNSLKRAYVEFKIIPQTPASGDWKTLAENIDVIRFQYQIEDDGSWEWHNSVSNSDDFENIRAVKIMMLGSSRDSAYNQSITETFVFPIEDDTAFSYTPLPNSGYKRLMSTVVQTRNNRDN